MIDATCEVLVAHSSSLRGMLDAVQDHRSVRRRAVSFYVAQRFVQREDGVQQSTGQASSVRPSIDFVAATNVNSNNIVAADFAEDRRAGGAGAI